MRETGKLSPLLVPKREAFDTIGVGNTKGHELINEGRLIAVKLGSRTMIQTASLHEFVASLPAFVSKAAA